MKTYHGPIRVSKNGRYFEQANGEPFFWLGDTCWPLFGQYTKEEAERYLTNRAEKRFTVIQCVAAWGGTLGQETPQPGVNFTGEPPWVGGNPAKPNPAYFENVDYLLRYAEQAGLVLAILPTWGLYVSEIQTINLHNARIYGRWLGERYRDTTNLVWINGGDRIPTWREEVYRELALGLREGDGGKHLITYHPCGWRSSSEYWHEEEWLDFNMIETWTEWTKVYDAVRADTMRTPIKPVVLGEGAYEDGPEYPMGPITPLVVRRQAWWTVMAGGFFTYGQNQMWRMEPGWEKAFDTPGATQMGIMRKVVESRRWWEMIPDQSIFASGFSAERILNTAMRTKDSRCYMLYLADACHVLLYLNRILSKKARATWVNPQTGEEVAGGEYETSNLIEGKFFADWEKTLFSTPAYWEDAVLILDGID